MSPSLQDSIVGLDFGTTTTRCAVYDGDRPRPIMNAEGRETTPTVVSVADDGTLLAGKRAASRAVTHPERTATDLVDRLRTGDPFVVDDVSYPPETLAAAVVARGVPAATDGDESTPRGVVLTVPNRATRTYRRRLRDAVSLSGLRTERIVLATSAAAMATTPGHGDERNVLVCDLGGGTFDVGLFEVDRGAYITETTGGGDVGGDDWDRAVVDHLAERFDADHGVDLRDDAGSRRRLIEAAADARTQLSARERSEVNLPFVTVTDDGPLDLEEALTREQLNGMTVDLRDRLVERIEAVLDAAGVVPADVDDVVLAGGTTRMPAVREAIEAAVDRVPSTGVDPAVAGAFGAAIQGGILTGTIDDVVLIDQCPRPIGVVVDDEDFEPIVERDTSIPTDGSKTFTTTVDGQREARIRIREGGIHGDDGVDLGDFVAGGIPDAPAGEPRIDVRVDVDENEFVNIGAESADGKTLGDLLVGDEPRLTDSAVAWSRWVLFGQAPGDSDLPDVPPEDPAGIAAYRPAYTHEPLPTNQVHTGDVPGITRPPLLPAALGVETATGGFETLVEAGTPLPCRESKTFTTGEDNQTSVRVRALCGDDDPEPIGEFTVPDVPRAPAGIPEVGIEFAVDADGVLTVSSTAETDGTAETAQFRTFAAADETDGDADTDDTGTDDDAERRDCEETKFRRADRSPTADEIERLLDVRDDLTRALDADADDPGPIQEGLRATRRKLDRLTAGEVTGMIDEAVVAVADDIDRAVDGDPRTVDRLHGWVRSTRRRIDGALERSEVTLVDPAPGTRLDPDRHSAGTTVESTRPRGTILEVRRVGYTRDGRVERPATVVVSDGSAAAERGPPEEVPRAPDRGLDYGALVRGDRIGRGGRADVYEATVEGDGLTVALKEPRFSGTLHAEIGERFVDEARTWAGLDDHDHVVGVVDWGERPVPWIAMEFMDCGDLSDRAGELPTTQALWTAVATTRGVHHAHRHGVAHLDLKPANVLFRSVEGGWDVPKVADWGLSRRLLERPRTTAEYTPTYAAPEQFDDDTSVDTVTDVYQLGAVCYELFTGRPPFRGDAGRIAERRRTETPPPPSDFADVPEALDDVLLTALATERGNRYESTLYLRDALRDVLEKVYDGDVRSTGTESGDRR
ncbi:nucleotide exchange factor GrpE [Haloplanus pelagicus]|uniref:nucleotide exchange factor GrpE n=1 Tax=Haloplanus pelagicus TaxID=2949995 RepID=UPI0020424912|nr:nucleotide exchange factor GrpE [Haloplanus sp. HW8-1]